MTDTVWVQDFAKKCPDATPWGAKQGESCAAIRNRRFHFVDTASHGGLYLSVEDRLQLHPKLAQMGEGGTGEWWEEDVACCVPIWWLCRDMLLEGDQAEFVEAVTRGVKAEFPDIFEELTGEIIPVQQSSEKRRRAAEAANANKFVVSAAWGDWAEWVPSGLVGVFARRAADRAEAYFLVQEPEYKTHPEFGFIVDPYRHLKVQGPQ